MNPPAVTAPSQIEQWATRQLADYDARTPGSLFTEGLVLDVAQGYELQAAVARLRCRRGERVIGYKVGCTSPTIRAQLGIDHCVAGRLYHSERHPTGSALSRQGFAHLAIEGELAVELAREPVEDDFAGLGLPGCVSRVFPVIELHYLVMHSVPPSAGELIAHNALHAGFVAGEGVVCGESSEPPSLAIFSDYQLVEQCTGVALIETIRSSLRWLSGVLRSRGDRLGAGQIVLTGSIPSLIPIDSNCLVRVDAPPFGSVEAQFIH